MNSKSLLIAVLLSSILCGTFTRTSSAEEAEKLSEDLALVPAGVQVFFSLHLGNHLREGKESESLKQLAKSHPMFPLSLIKDLKGHSGLTADEIERVVVFQNRPGRWFGVLTTHEPYDREKVFAKLVPEAVEKEAAGKKYLSSSKSFHSVCVLSDRRLLLGFGHDLKDFLSRQEIGERRVPLKRALQAANNDTLVVLHLGAPFSFSFTEEIGRGSFVTLANSEALQVMVEAGETLKIHLHSDMESKEDLVEAIKETGPKVMGFILGAKNMMVTMLKQQDAQYPGAKLLASQLGTALDAAVEAVEKMDVSVSGSLVKTTVDIKTDKPITTANLLLILMFRVEEK